MDGQAQRQVDGWMVRVHGWRDIDGWVDRQIISLGFLLIVVCTYRSYDIKYKQGINVAGHVTLQTSCCLENSCKRSKSHRKTTLQSNLKGKGNMIDLQATREI